MSRLLASAAAGLLFGCGLALAGMTDPTKVLDFLDVTGRWDPSLLLVLGGAVSVAFIGFRLVRRQPRPWFDDRFHLPAKQSVDVPLVTGAAIFGIGWGIAGYCPGPAVALLAAPAREAAIFIPALIVGFLLHRWTRGPARADGCPASSR